MLKIHSEIVEKLQCPQTGNKLSKVEEHFTASGGDIKLSYPIINGIPILLDETKSIFNISDIINGKDTTINTSLYSDSFVIKVKKNILKYSPTISTNISSKKNFIFLRNYLKNDQIPTKKTILVVGGVTVGKGMDAFINESDFIFVEGDVTLGPRTNIVFDAHQIPFAENTFDAVIIQAVMEHLIDPYTCANEIHRVLKPNGIVYAETPFMQQVHMGAYDFTRFTDLGHRRLFRKFEQIDRGIACGPGMALAWSYYYFLLSFTKNKLLRKCIWFFACFTSFFLKYFDYFLKNKSSAYDAASGFYFILKKSDNVLTDKELIKEFRGQFNG